MTIFKSFLLGILTLMGILIIIVGIFLAQRGNQAVPYKSTFDQLPISPQAWQARGQTFVFDSNEIFFVDEGEGDTTLLLHGYPTSSWDYHKIWPGLEVNNRLIAPDFLGYGFSAKPTGYTYSVANHADMLTALMIQQGVSELRIIAHDIGLGVAQELITRANANELPFTIESVVFLNGTLFDADRRPNTIQNLLAGPLGGIVNAAVSEETYVRNLVAITGSNNGTSALEFEAAWYLHNYPASDRIFHKLLHVVDDRIENDARWADAVCASTMPLHLVIGVQDSTSGLILRDSLAEYCREQRSFAVTVLDDVGHFPHLERPDDVLEALMNWEGGGYE